MNVLVPSTLSGALEMAAEHPTYALLAGGSDIVPALKKGEDIPGLISLGKLEELREIAVGENEVRIGASVSVAEMMENHELMTLFPILEKAAQVFGSRQIRSVATIGGNIAHASPAADLVPVVLVLGGMANIEGPEGKRSLGMEEVIGSYRRSALKPGEIITAVRLPLGPWSGYYYRKIGRRSALNIAVASLAAVAEGRGDGGWSVRMSGASLSPTPRRMLHTEALFLSPGILSHEAVTEALKQDIDPRSGKRGSAEYRLRVCANMVMEFADALGR
jgi:CO/xanthine dehydrogenase FAD-binding subunit